MSPAGLAVIIEGKPQEDTQAATSARAQKIHCARALFRSPGCCIPLVRAAAYMEWVDSHYMRILTPSGMPTALTIEEVHALRKEVMKLIDDEHEQTVQLIEHAVKAREEEFRVERNRQLAAMGYKERLFAKLKEKVDLGMSYPRAVMEKTLLQRMIKTIDGVIPHEATRRFVEILVHERENVPMILQYYNDGDYAAVKDELCALGEALHKDSPAGMCFPETFSVDPHVYFKPTLQTLRCDICPSTGWVPWFGWTLLPNLKRVDFLTLQRGCGVWPIGDLLNPLHPQGPKTHNISCPTHIKPNSWMEFQSWTAHQHEEFHFNAPLTVTSGCTVTITVKEEWPPLPGGPSGSEVKPYRVAVTGRKPIAQGPNVLTRVRDEKPKYTPKRKHKDIYEVERILEARTAKGGGTEYLIKWKGYHSNENTWEPRAHINDGPLIAEFERAIVPRKLVGPVIQYSRLLRDRIWLWVNGMPQYLHVREYWCKRQTGRKPRLAREMFLDPAPDGTRTYLRSFDEVRRQEWWPRVTAADVGAKPTLVTLAEYEKTLDQ